MRVLSLRRFPSFDGANPFEEFAHARVAHGFIVDRLHRRFERGAIDLLDDLVADLDGITCDVVGGLDAMGFVLGSALAARLGVGFLPIRKAGKLSVDTDKVSFSNYSGRTQDMEMRKPAFALGTKVLLVDQWLETGGTMDGAIRLVERQGGKVVAIAAVAIEENPVTDAYRTKYRCVSGVQQGSRWQTECNAQTLKSFETYRPELVFPTIR